MCGNRILQWDEVLEGIPLRDGLNFIKWCGTKLWDGVTFYYFASWETVGGVAPIQISAWSKQQGKILHVGHLSVAVMLTIPIRLQDREVEPTHFTFPQHLSET